MATKLAELADVDEDAGPWAAYGKSRQSITQRQIAKLLAEFSIFPRNIRPATGTGVPKGYLREQFDDAFERYLSHSSELTSASSATPLQTNDSKDLEEIQSATSDLSVADRNDLNSLQNNDCSGVADRNLSHLKNGLSVHVCAQCRGSPDGKEELCPIGDQAVWLHPECRPFFEKEARKEKRT